MIGNSIQTPLSLDWRLTESPNGALSTGELNLNRHDSSNVSTENVEQLSYPKVDSNVIGEYVTGCLPELQSRLVSELILKSAEWAAAYRLALKTKSGKKSCEENP